MLVRGFCQTPCLGAPPWRLRGLLCHSQTSFGPVLAPTAPVCTLLESRPWLQLCRQSAQQPGPTDKGPGRQPAGQHSCPRQQPGLALLPQGNGVRTFLSRQDAKRLHLRGFGVDWNAALRRARFPREGHPVISSQSHHMMMALRHPRIPLKGKPRGTARGHTISHRLPILPGTCPGADPCSKQRDCCC